jgi:hypothetical protein
MSHVETIETVKLQLLDKNDNKLGYIKNNGTGDNSTMRIVENEGEATVFNVQTYDKHSTDISDPNYYQLKENHKYYLDVHEHPTDLLKQKLFADKPHLSVSASSVASWVLGSDGYLTTRVGGISLGKREGNDDLFGVPSKADALIVKAITVK